LEKTLVLPIKNLQMHPYASVICYPKASKTEIENRLKELRKLGVAAIEFCGEKHAFNVPVLGKGCVGIVVVAYVGEEKTALKIRRVDAGRPGLWHEAKMLRKANSVHVGPELLAVSKDFLLMQFIDGNLLPDWLESHRGKARVRRVIREILEQCWRLDTASLDHGELSHAPKHFIVDKKEKPFMVDFETASVGRRPSNVTSICQFLFIGSTSAKIVTERLGERNMRRIVETLKAYKRNRTRQNFDEILKVCLS
jgi:putative serine/threonine protein kinase